MAGSVRTGMELKIFTAGMSSLMVAAGGRGHNADGWQGGLGSYRCSWCFLLGKDWTIRNSQSCHLILKLSHSGFIDRIINHFLLLILVYLSTAVWQQSVDFCFVFFSLFHSSVTQEEVKSTVLHLCHTVSLITLGLPDTAFKEIADATEATFIELRTFVSHIYISLPANSKHLKQNR